MADFRILMNNKLEMGPYDQPGHPTSTGQEYLIVDIQGEMLAISDTSKIDPAGPDDQLSNRAPNLTMYGLLLFQEPDSSGSLASAIAHNVFALGPRNYYLLVHDLPAEAPAAGTFFPVDGVACIQLSFLMRWRLHAAGRHGTAASGSSWQFTARQKPWFAITRFVAADRFSFDGFGGG